MFKIQIFHPSSRAFLNTNHESEDLEVLKSLLNKPAFAGSRYQIVDQNGIVHYSPVAVERSSPMTIEDIAQSLGVPVVDPGQFGLFDEASSYGTYTNDVGYTLEAVHNEDGEPIVSFRLEEAQAREIRRELWADVDFWAAPGGASMQVETKTQAETINRVLGDCWIMFQPERHRWLFHVHLV